MLWVTEATMPEYRHRQNRIAINYVIAVILSILQPGLGHFIIKDDKRAAFLIIISLSLLAIIHFNNIDGLAGLESFFVFFLRAILPIFLIVIVVMYAVISVIYRFKNKRQKCQFHFCKRRILVSIVTLVFLLSTAHATDSCKKDLTWGTYSLPITSMAPTILKGEVVIGVADDFAVEQPKRCDIVVFENKQDKSSLYLKRVIGIPGDIVVIHEKGVFVLNESNNSHPVNEKIQNIIYKSEKVPPGHVFVIGDNLAFSLDSRNDEIGFVSNTAIKSKILYIGWSHNISRVGRKIHCPEYINTICANADSI